MKKKVNVVFYSRTGITRRVAEKIFSWLSKKMEVGITEIKPKVNYPYFVWLFLSFLPKVGVKVDCEPIDGNLVVLCFPKWTINCPPITRFLQRNDLSEKKLIIVISYGGFGEKQYGYNYRKEIEKKCKEVKGVFLIKRSNILKEKEEFEHLIQEIAKLVENELEKTGGYPPPS
jgi:flavodoxin